MSSLQIFKNSNTSFDWLLSLFAELMLQMSQQQCVKIPDDDDDDSVVYFVRALG
jgi:hypothetical protein